MERNIGSKGLEESGMRLYVLRWCASQQSSRLRAGLYDIKELEDPGMRLPGQIGEWVLVLELRRDQVLAWKVKQHRALKR